MTITNSSLRLVALVAGVAVSLALMGAVAIAPAQAAGLSQTQIQSITSLLASFGADAATIANVTAALNGQATPGTTPSTPSTGGACPTLTRSLQQGSNGADVKALQVFLNGNAQTQVSVSGAGSPGNESTFFGPATAAAVKKFQTLNNVSSIGIVGPQTRAAIAAVCGNTTPGNPGTPGTPTTGGAVTVSAAAQPVNSLAPAGASRVPFTTFTVRNNSAQSVTVNSVTVQRVGLGVNANLSGVVLVDQNGIQIGIAKTLNSNNQANLDGFVLMAGESKTLTVTGNIADSSTAQSGQIVGVNVVAINTGATVSGALPISGASQTINTTLSLGSFTTATSSFDPGSAQTKSIGDVGVRFTGLRFTASSVEDLKLYSIRWRQVGSASASDLGNVVTIANGTTYPTTLSADGKYYTTIFPGGLTILKGQSVDAYVQGDIVGSNVAGRTARFDIDRSTDVYFVGQTYGYGVVGTNVNAQPWIAGNTVTISPGSASTISRANEVGAQNISINVAGQPLGGFATDFIGEPVSVQTMTLTIATSSAVTGLITDVTLVNANGSVVAGPVDATWVSGAMTVRFTDTVTFPVGRQVYTLKGKIPSTATGGATVQVTVTPSNWTNVLGQISGSNITISQGGFTLNSMTVKGSSLTVALSAQPSSQTITSSMSGFTFANVLLDASQSGEDIRVNNVSLRVNNNTGLTGCQLFDGTTALNYGSNIITTLSTSGDNNFVFNNQVVVAKGTVKTLALKCNLNGGSGTYTWTLAAATAPSVTGVTSGNSLTATNSGNAGGSMLVGTASAAVSVDASSPSYTVAAAGSTGVTVGVIKVRSSNETTTLKKLGVTISNNALVNRLYLFDGATMVGEVTFAGGNTATSSELAVSLPADTDKTITVKADIATITTGNSATVEGALLTVNPSSSEIQSNSSGTINTGASGSTAGVRIYKTFPTIALDTLSTSGLIEGKLMRFKVTANSAGTLGLGELTFKIASSSGVTVTNVQLFAFNDASYSSAISGQGTSGQVGGTVATVTSGSEFTIAPDLNPVQVSAGSTMFFELRASVSGVVSGSSVVTTLMGDSTSAGVAAFATQSSSYKFVWSPNATTTAATTTGNDWANGAGVPGLPAGGLFQTRSQ